MSEQRSSERDRIRAAEVIGAMCLATDLGMGFPFEHGLQATMMTMRLAEHMDADSETATQTYYASLLMYSGCTTDADVASRIFPGGSTRHVVPVQFGSRRQVLAGAVRAMTPTDLRPPHRIYELARRLPAARQYLQPHLAAICEVAEMLAERLGLPASIQQLFALLTERWDGGGLLARSGGEDIPVSLRVVHVARDAAYQRLIHDDSTVVEVIRSRAGHAFDPRIAARFVEASHEILDAAPKSLWEYVLAAEPKPWLYLEGGAIDRALGAMGDFADLASPYLSGHSAGTATLTDAAARVRGFASDDISLARRAALVHDIGRAAVHPIIWQKEAVLSSDDWEQIRLHAYHTERILHQSAFLAKIADVASAHHERLDGNGYHRRANAASLSPIARLVATADAFHAMTEPRIHRPALTAEQAARQLADEAASNRLDPGMVEAVLEAAGRSSVAIERPADLTAREAEVIGLVAGGFQTKQVARALGISAKTADRHIQNSYRKMGVSTRAAATLFAMEHGLVGWGEVPIP